MTEKAYGSEQQHKRRKIRVAQIVGKTTLGGVCNIVLDYYRGLDRNAYEFDFYTYGESKYDALVKELGGNVYHISNFINFPKAMSELNRAFKERHYDIVHSHLTALSVFPLAVARRRKIAVRICHAHSTSYWFELKTVVKNVLKRFSRFFATNYLACGKKTAKWMYGRKARECIIIPNAIDFSKFYADKASGIGLRSSQGIKKEEKVVGFAGRFVYQKNLFFLLRVMRRLIEKRPNYKLLLCGDGKEKEKLKKTAIRYGIEKNVIFLSVRNGDQMKAVYNAMDVFCLPSRFEGLPLSSIESTACGVPGIYSDKITDEILLSDNIRLPIHSVKKWVRAIVRSASAEKPDEELMEERRTALKYLGYDIKSSAKKLQRYYDGCLEGKLPDY